MTKEKLWQFKIVYNKKFENMFSVTKFKYFESMLLFVDKTQMKFWKFILINGLTELYNLFIKNQWQSKRLKFQKKLTFLKKGTYTFWWIWFFFFLKKDLIFVGWRRQTSTNKQTAFIFVKKLKEAIILYSFHLNMFERIGWQNLIALAAGKRLNCIW